MFANSFGGSLFVSFGKTVFSNRLGPALQDFAAGVNSQDVINAGATGVREAVSEEELSGVLLALNESLTQTFVSRVSLDTSGTLTNFAVPGEWSCYGCFLHELGLGMEERKEAESSGA
jgi:hypothetical protein